MRCMAVAARPPYSSGQCTAAHRPSLRTRCQLARRCCSFSGDMAVSSASSSPARNGWRCSSSHERSSSRNASSSGASAKSTGSEANGSGSTLSERRTAGTPATVPRGYQVDFTFDAEQLALQDVARRAMDEVGGDAVRAMADDPVGFSPEQWERLVSLGWTALLEPGSGGGLLEACIVLEQMGRVPLPGPFFSSSVLAMLAARALGAGDLVAELAAGGQRGTVALHEQGHGHPLDTVRARARRRGSEWVVSGAKPTVVDGHERGLGDRGGAGRGRDPLVPPALPEGRGRPRPRPDPQARPSGARRGAGRAARSVR